MGDWISDFDQKRRGATAESRNELGKQRDASSQARLADARVRQFLSRLASRLRIGIIEGEQWSNDRRHVDYPAYVTDLREKRRVEHTAVLREQIAFDLLYMPHFVLGETERDFETIHSYLHQSDATPLNDCKIILRFRGVRQTPGRHGREPVDFRDRDLICRHQEPHGEVERTLFGGERITKRDGVFEVQPSPSHSTAPKWLRTAATRSSHGTSYAILPFYVRELTDSFLDDFIRCAVTDSEFAPQHGQYGFFSHR